MRYLVSVFSVSVSAALIVGASANACAQSEHVTPDQGAPNPLAMPGDFFDIPQSVQVKVPLGPAAGPNPRPSAPAQPLVPGPGLPLAVVAAQAAEASCRADGYIVAVAVTDSAGNLKAALAPDGTRSNGVFMAMHKALTVVGFRMSTLDLRAKIEADPSVMAQVKPNMSLLPGGLPIFRDKVFIGAIATSGAAAHEEEKCAQAGIAALLAGS